GKAVTHELPNWVLTPNFSIEWGPNLTNEDGTRPVSDADGDSIPDVVERWAELFEASFATVAQVLKPAAPDSVYAGTALATDRIPIYLGNSSPASTVDDISSGTYAFTQDASPAPYIVVNNNLSFVPPNDDPEGRLRGAMKITAAHEFFHVIQFLYEPGVWIPTDDDWWLETSSTWMEDEVFDVVNDYYQYFGTAGWASTVEAGLPVVFGTSQYITRAYGGVIFAKYLAEHVGGQEMMGEIWDLIRPAPGRRALDALDAYAASRGLADVETLFLGFSAANAVMDYEEGANFGLVPIRSTGTLDHAETAPALVPDYLGATYLLRSGNSAGLEVSLTGSPGVRWGLSLVVDRAQGYSLALGASLPAGAGSLTVGSLDAGDALYAIPAFLSPSATSLSYATATAPAPGADAAAPGLPSNFAPVPTAGGFDATWTPPADVDLAGHVVRWRLQGDASYSSRTLVAPIRAVEVRSLAVGTYVVEILAYDAAGNVGSARTGAVSVALAQADARIPASDTIILESSSASPSGDGGGGGGGGGCFLDLLAH
ncbi:MAG: hypothetical protein IH608_11155, partial [Proteobacteria bacterium]|nr:hypothetical protein [Pseudomonadota bacterium]